VSRPVYRGPSFTHPDLVRPGRVPGFELLPTGGLAMVELEDSIRQAIYLLVTTIPGERVMRPDYGCDLYQLVFAPNDNTTAGLAIHYVKRALDRFEPRVDVVRIDAGENPDDPGQLDITLEYRVRATQQPGRVTVSMSLTGEQP
jgi:phage baseplate assembly protein W